MTDYRAKERKEENARTRNDNRQGSSARFRAITLALLVLTISITTVSTSQAQGSCGTANLTDLVAFDHVFVMDPAEPVNIATDFTISTNETYTVWTESEYFCLMPEPQDPDETFLDLDWQDNATFYEPFYDSEGTGDWIDTPIPPYVYYDDELAAQTSAASSSFSFRGQGTGPRTGPSNSDIIVVIIAPKPGNMHEGDRGCNLSNTKEAILAIENIQPVNLRYTCNLGWDPTKTNHSGMCSTADSGSAKSKQKDDILIRAFEYGRANGFNDAPNELTMAWVGQLWASNGVSCQSLHTALGAEDATDWPNWYERSIALHEIGHLFAAEHYPNDKWSYKNACRKYHWDHGHWHYYRSVMNYCYADKGYMAFDNSNAYYVKLNAQDTT